MSHVYKVHFAFWIFQSWHSLFFAIIVNASSRNLWLLSILKWENQYWEKQNGGKRQWTGFSRIPMGAMEVSGPEKCNYFRKQPTILLQLMFPRWCVHIRRCWSIWIWQWHYLGNLAWPVVLHEEVCNENHPIQQSVSRWTAAQLRQCQTGATTGQRKYLKWTQNIVMISNTEHGQLKISPLHLREVGFVYHFVTQVFVLDFSVPSTLLFL